MTCDRRVPRTLAGIDGSPILNDHVHVAVEVADETGVRTVRRILHGDAHVFAGETVEKIVIHVHVRILIVREVVVNVRLAIDPLGTGNPAGKPLGDRPMVHPVFHVATLPSVVTALPRIEAAGGVVLVREARGLQRHVEPL